MKAVLEQLERQTLLVIRMRKEKTDLFLALSPAILQVTNSTPVMFLIQFLQIRNLNWTDVKTWLDLKR